MGKRKTRQEKKIADLRRKLSQTSSPATAPEKKTEKHPEHISYAIAPTMTLKRSIAPQNYSYVTHDLRKTIMVTVSITAFQLLLFVLLKLHIIHVFITY